MVVIEMASNNEKSDSDEAVSSTDEEFEGTGDAIEGNPGWADSIAQVLKTNKPKAKKSLVLSKAKKIKQTPEEEKTYDFQIEGEIKQEKPDKALLDKALETKPLKNKVLKLRAKPSFKDRERESTLKKIATKGVVQLFNAVRTQQKELSRQLDEAGPLDHRKDAVLKNINKTKFLDVLMAGNRAKSELVDNYVKKEEVKEEDSKPNSGRNTEWSVLSNDFMTGKKFKHWDKEDSDSDNQKGSNDDSDDESEGD